MRRKGEGRGNRCAASALPAPPRTVMKSGPEIVKAGLRSFFESASEDIEKMVENLRLGKVSQARTQVKGVGQNLTYTTVALLPVLTTLFQHIAQHQFGDDVICKDSWGQGARGGCQLGQHCHPEVCGGVIIRCWNIGFLAVNQSAQSVKCREQKVLTKI